MLTRKKISSGTLFGNTGKDADYGKLDEDVTEHSVNECKDTFYQTAVATPRTKPKNSISKLLSLPRRISLESKQAPSFDHGYQELGAPSEQQTRCSYNYSTANKDLLISLNEQEKLGVVTKDEDLTCNAIASPGHQNNPKKLHLRTTLSEGDTPYFMSNPLFDNEKLTTSSTDISPHVLHRTLRVASVGNETTIKEREEHPLYGGIDYPAQYQNNSHSTSNTKESSNITKLLSWPRKVSSQTKYPSCFSIGYNKLERDQQTWNRSFEEKKDNCEDFLPVFYDNTEANMHSLTSAEISRSPERNLECEPWHVVNNTFLDNEISPANSKKNSMNTVLSLPRRISSESKHPVCFSIGYDSLNHYPQTNSKSFLQENEENCEYFSPVFEDSKGSMHSFALEKPSMQNITEREFEGNNQSESEQYSLNNTFSAHKTQSILPRTDTKNNNVKKLLSLPRRITSESKHPPCFGVDYKELEVSPSTQPSSEGWILDWTDQDFNINNEITNCDKLRWVMEPT